MYRCPRCRRFTFDILESCTCKAFRVWIPELGEEDAEEGSTVWAFDAETAARCRLETSDEPHQFIDSTTAVRVAAPDGSETAWSVRAEESISWYTEALPDGDA